MTDTPTEAATRADERARIVASLRQNAARFRGMADSQRTIGGNWMCHEKAMAVEEVADAIERGGAGVTAPPRPPASTHSPETSGAGGNGQPEPSEALSALRGEPVDLDAARQRINRAHTELGEVCAQGPSRRFKMHIPADPERDTDLIISAALTDAEHLAAEVERLRAEAKALANLAVAAEDACLWEGVCEEARAKVARVRDLADRLGREPHPTHDHLCPDGLRAELLAALDGAGAVPEEQTGGGTGRSRALQRPTRAVGPARRC